ncbi:hypothetical protein B0H13DRAFT_2166787 [Mycena leptocephala]|nr:hypothetical protein B0H13DRAFT_2166787 [Mycena leptocephala]
MPPRAKPFDLKNVAKLFNDTIAAIRDNTPDFKALEPQTIYPTLLPTVLQAYRPAIRENLLTLLKDCGFNHCSSPALDPSRMFFEIRFPAQVAAAPLPPQHPPLCTGAVKPRLGGFSASNLACLLTDARAAARIPDCEEESDDEEARPRLRSVTRASSAATLRESSSVNTRRSGRKRVKREE